MADVPEVIHVRPPSDVPQDVFLDFDAKTEQNGVEDGEGGELEVQRAPSPQFSTTSTVSGAEMDPNTDDEGLDEGGRVGQVRQASSGVGRDPLIAMETTKETEVVATTTGTWERFEPAPSQSQWETFEQSGNGTGEGTRDTETNGTRGSADGATALEPETKPAGQSTDGTGAVCAADAMVSSGWTALGAGLAPFDDNEDEEAEKNLPYRLTRSMRATTNRKVQIVDSLKQQRRLSNTSLDRDPSRGGGGPFANEDELSRRYNVEREWQVFVKMNKRVPGTRSKWLPVSVQVKNGELVIKKSSPPSLSSSSPHPPSPPIHEFRLSHNHTMTEPFARHYDRKTKLHQIKLRQSRIQEKRTLKRWLFVDHVTRVHTVVKIGCPDLTTITSLSQTISEAIRQLPINRQAGVAYRMNEVFVDVKDQAEILMNCDGAVLERTSLNRIYLQAFITNLPKCHLVMNDIEALLLLGRGGMTTSMSRQVRLTDVVLHPCVDQAPYKATRELDFTPIDGYPFEVLRASVEPYKSPPITVTALMEYNEPRNTVSMTAKFSVRKKFNVRQEPISNLMLKFPVPSNWSGLFMADSPFGGKRSVQSTSALRGSFRRKIRSSSAYIQVYMGSAKYESEHSALVWRIGNYQRSETAHTFRCDIQLKQGMTRPTITDEHCEVSYSIPGSSTGLEIRTFKAEGHNPERWVKYEINYKYKVQMFPDLSID